MPLGADPSRKGAVDAVVVGSGAGGGPVAMTLARAGYKVVVLEKGPAYNQRDFLYDEIRSCRRDFFVPTVSQEPHVQVLPGGRAVKTHNGWTANCVGGATVHFSGFTYRLHPEDFKLRSLLGPLSGSTLVDWPIAWEQFEPYYERAEYALGVSGAAGTNPFEKHRRPFPLEPLRENGMARLIDQACAQLGLHSYPTPRAILSRPWNGRAGCRHSFFCGSYGCETGAKSSIRAAVVPDAVATGNCQIRPRCMVHRIETDHSGRATAVRYLDAKGQQQRLETAVVVVACSAIESARLLLMSTSPAHPQGVGNQFGQVGRNLMFAGSGAGEAEFERDDARVQGIDWSEPFINRSFQDLYLVRGAGRQVDKGGTVNFLFPHANPIYRAEQLATGGAELLWGQRLKDAIRREHRDIRRLEFEVFAESLPMGASGVSLDPQVKDRWGLPAARFETTQHSRDRKVCDQIVGRGLEVLSAMGGSNVRGTRGGQQTYWLQGGTCRFGKDPRASVLDPDCRVHQAPNVFVTDGSFMPTSGGVPNTLTIEANAFRVGDRIVALGKAHQLFGKGSS